MATNLLQQLQQSHPNIRFAPGRTFRWSPRTKTVTYVAAELHDPRGQWALVHEASHAVLNHRNYETDFELLQLEVAAWEHAQTLAHQLGIHISDDHIQDCLDTYRDWLHRRSTCPTCGNVSLQRDSKTYRCHNCFAIWEVSPARFCRPYRRLAKQGV